MHGPAVGAEVIGHGASLPGPAPARHLGAAGPGAPVLSCGAVALHPLTNDRWGFRSNCFVCEPANPAGLRIPFHHDDEGSAVVAEFQLADAFSGAPTYVHGGITLAILDEAMAWAAIAIAGQFAVTQRTTTEFHRPVRVDRPHRVEARITSQEPARITASAHVLDAKGRVCAEATATFLPLDARQASVAVGTEVAGADANFVRPPAP